MSRRPTPGYNVHLEIAFTTDRHGRPIAYRWSPSSRRWMRMSLSDARIFVAEGEATQVPYTGSRTEQIESMRAALGHKPPDRTSNDRSRRRDVKKVYSLYGRNGYQGPWTFLGWHHGKREAEDDRQRHRYRYAETKILREFDYEARSRARGA